MTIPSNFYGIRRIISAIVLSLTVMLMMGAGDQQARFNDLGHKMMCVCGCAQILLECNHVGCTYSEGMRGELGAGIDRGDSDSLVLQSFAQKYGATVIASPIMTTFDLTAWIVPVAAFFTGLAMLIFMVRMWRNRPVAATVAVGIPRQQVDEFRERARKETELGLQLLR